MTAWHMTHPGYWELRRDDGVILAKVELLARYWYTFLSGSRRGPFPSMDAAMMAAGC